MAAIRTNYQRFHIAQQFLESFTEAAATVYYLFIGKASDWTEEPTPDTPVSTFEQDDRLHWNEMIGGEKIAASDVSLVIPRVNWAEDEVYIPYDDQDDSLFEKDFYVLTTDNNVYKCIDNNADAASTVMPTGTGTAMIETADGYIWKYMYTISTANALKFLSNNYMPVQYLTADDGSAQWDVQEAAVDGAIDRIEVLTGGSGYDTEPTVTIQGDGTGATATASLDSGAVDAITITDAGSGYTYANIVFSGGTPDVAATARAVNAPKGGHGANAVKELGGFFLMCRVELNQDESGSLPVVNDYRKIGIMIDPFDFGTETVSEVSNFDQTLRITVEPGFTGSFEIDEVITGATSGAKGKVVDWDSENRIIRVNELSIDIFEEDEVVSTASGSGTVETLTDPDLEPMSGEVIWIDQRAPITRASNQIETIRTVFEF